MKTVKTGDSIRIRINEELDDGFNWINFSLGDVNDYADYPTRNDARMASTKMRAIDNPSRIARVIKRTPKYIHAEVTK